MPNFSKSIEEKLNNDMNIIVDLVCKNLKTKPISIFLCGGYGRNEGAWLINWSDRLRQRLGDQSYG